MRKISYRRKSDKALVATVLLLVVAGCDGALTPILPPDLAGSWAAVPVPAVPGGAQGLRLEFQLGQMSDAGVASGTGRIGYYNESAQGVKSWFTYHSINTTLTYASGGVTLEYATGTCASNNPDCRGSVTASWSATEGITGTMSGIYAVSGPRALTVRRCPDAGLALCW